MNSSLCFIFNLNLTYSPNLVKWFDSFWDLKHGSGVLCTDMISSVWLTWKHWVQVRVLSFRAAFKAIVLSSVDGVEVWAEFYLNFGHSFAVSFSSHLFCRWFNKWKKKGAWGKIGAQFKSHILCPYRSFLSSHHHKSTSGVRQNPFQKQLKVRGKKMMNIMANNKNKEFLI